MAKRRKGKASPAAPSRPGQAQRTKKPTVPSYSTIANLVDPNLVGQRDNVYSIISNCILVTGEGVSTDSIGPSADGGHILLDNPDLSIFPITAGTLDQANLSNKDISKISLYSLLKGPHGPGKVFDSQSHAIQFLEAVRFKTTDSSAMRVAKIREFYKHLSRKGVGGLPMFPASTINAIPYPQYHSTYLSDVIKDKVDITDKNQKKYVDNTVNLGASSIARTFAGNFDQEYADAAIRQILKPHIKNATLALIKEIDRLGNLPARINVASPNFLDREILDIIHAVASSNNQFLAEQYEVTDIFLNNLKEYPKNSILEQRGYTQQNNLEYPVWRLTSCTGCDVYYVEQQPYWSYSITGIFGLISDKSNTSFLDPDEVFTGNKVVFLKEYSTGEVYDIYSRYQSLIPIPSYASKPWADIQADSSTFFYPQDAGSGLPTGFHTGCYKVDIGWTPDCDSGGILPYNTLTNYFIDTDCSNVDYCHKPPPPSLTPTQTQTHTPNPTLTATRTQPPTSTPTKTPTQTLSPTKTQTQTQTQTHTQT